MLPMGRAAVAMLVALAISHGSSTQTQLSREQYEQDCQGAPGPMRTRLRTACDGCGAFWMELPKAIDPDLPQVVWHGARPSVVLFGRVEEGWRVGPIPIGSLPTPVVRVGVVVHEKLYRNIRMRRDAACWWLRILPLPHPV